MNATLKKTILAGLVSTAAIASITAPANAGGKFKFKFGFGHLDRHWVDHDPCAYYHWKWHHTGRYYWKKKYYKCMGWW